MQAFGTPLMFRNGIASALIKRSIGGPGSPYDERWLQKLIHDHPSCLPLDQIEPGLSQPVPICMELALPSGFLDNLLITPQGDIVIVKVKLWKNPEMRRTVVAQALDYAASLFSMTYEEIENAVLSSEVSRPINPTRLYDFFDGPDTLDEDVFIDAVNKNLQRGRLVVLVVGDGIRTELKSLVEGLQAHAGMHFTFALVELGIFGIGGSNEIVIVPNTLTQTYGIERGIVRIEDNRTIVVPAEMNESKGSIGARETITSQQFFDAMNVRHPDLEGEIKEFINKLETIGVYPEFLRTLIFRWEPPNGKPINMGYIRRTGQIWTDAVSWSHENKVLAREYVKKLAHDLGFEVAYQSETPYVANNGKAPRIEELLGKFDIWFDAIQGFQKAYLEIE